MLRRYHILPRYLLLLASLALIVSTAAYAAGVSTQSWPSFQRILFDFGGAASLKLGQSDSALTLHFNRPMDASAVTTTAALKPYVTSAKLSADKMTLTLGLAKKYRVRQFISGNQLGVDLLTTQILPATPEAKPVAKPGVKKPVTTPAEKPVVKAEVKNPTPPAKPKPAPKPPAPPAIVPPTALPAEDMLTTKKTPEAAVAAPVIPVTTTDSLLTTKPETASAPAEAITTKPPVAAPVAETPAPAAPEKTAAVVKSAEEISPEQAAKETALPVAEPSKPMVVSTQKTKDGTAIQFPWSERTAAAVFERAHDIWIVFGREADASPKMLASTLPHQVVKVQQYLYPAATVLRLTTDGSLHASASQVKGTYEWQVLLGSSAVPPQQDIAINSDTENGRQELLLKAYDVSEPLAFYDPSFKDRLIVVPSYEAGRGVAMDKHFPELEVIATQQGIAVTTLRDDLRAVTGRTGVHLLADSSLAISDDLPIFNAEAEPVAGASAGSNVLLPYDQWYVAPGDFFKEREARLKVLASATPAQLPTSELRMAQLYMGQGMAAEALGYLQLLHDNQTAYFSQQKLGVMMAASHLMLNRIDEARADLADNTLDDVAEAQMWRKLLAIFPLHPQYETQTVVDDADKATAQKLQAAADAAVAQTGQAPTVAPPAQPPATFDFLGYNNDYIRFYPPRLRQRMAIIAADAYLKNAQADEALKTYDTLNRDGILGPVEPYAEYTLASVAAQKGKTDEALKVFDSLSNQYDDLYIEARARYAGAMLRYRKGLADADATASTLEALRVSWRGDALQHNILTDLAQIYTDSKRYDDTLRTWQYMLDTFPSDPETLQISADMADLFKKLFLSGMADDMPPLKSLALFYEFRDLTPIGEEGDTIIQKLADRLAAVDLLDRATQLLEHQIKFRLSGEPRAKVGARLAILYLINHQPQEALSVLEITNYGDADPELRRKRIQLTAKALSGLGKNEEALSMLFHDDSRDANLLRLDILWSMKDWPNVINQAEDILSARPNLTATLDPQETEVLMKLALGYSFERDTTQLKYLRDYYTGLLPETPYKEIFDFLTNDTAPLDAADFSMVAQQINHTESFLEGFKKQIADGKLSETLK